MHWIPNSSSRRWGACLSVILICTLFAPAASAHEWGGWSRPLLLREVDARTGYEARVDDEGRLHILSGLLTDDGVILQLWVTGSEGGAEVIWESGPWDDRLTGLSLLWFETHWHLAWGVDQVGMFYARICSEGQGEDPVKVISIERPLGTPFLVGGNAGMFLVYNSMCQGRHQVFVLSQLRSGEFSLPPVPLSHGEVMTRVAGVAFSDDTLYVSCLRHRETWVEMEVLAYTGSDDIRREQMGITSLQSPGQVSVAAWPVGGALLGWSGGAVTRGQLRLAWPTLGAWCGEDWLWGPFVIGEGASQIMSVRAATHGERFFASWIQVEENRMVTRTSWVNAEGEATDMARVVWDEREFFDPRPFIVSQYHPVLLASLRTGPRQYGIFLMYQEDSTPPWWFRLGLNPLDPWGDAAFKLFVGMMAGLLASMLALPALLLGVGGATLIARLRWPGAQMQGPWRLLVVFLIVWLCRRPESWLYVQILPVVYPAAYFTALISATAVLCLGKALRWSANERMQMMGMGLVFIIIDSWLGLAVGAFF